MSIGLALKCNNCGKLADFEDLRTPPDWEEVTQPSRFHPDMKRIEHLCPECKAAGVKLS